MTKSILFALAVAVLAVALLDLVDARCRRHDRKCCRRRIEYGGCRNHFRRYAYNISCGRCVPFDYSGCGGDDNVFDTVNDCSDCCQGTSPCPVYTLPKPPPACSYKWYDGPDYCTRPKLNCNCQPSYCNPSACGIGQQCIPYQTPIQCNTCPCPQYQCMTNPCYAISNQLSSCEKCIPVPAPSCNQQPCPLIPYRQNICPAAPPPPPAVYYEAPPPPAVYYEAPPPPQQCPVYVECPPEGNPCHHHHHHHCPAYPEAQCVVDQCDCTKYSYEYQGQQYSPSQCYYGRR